MSESLTAEMMISHLLERDCGGLCLDNETERLALADWILRFMDVMSEGPQPIITFQFSEPPPSANEIYTVSRGRKILTAAARKWKNRFVTSGGGAAKSDLMALDLSIHDELHMELWVYLVEGDVLNLGYGVDRRTKYPHAKVDTSNFFKLAEDAATELLGIACDRQNFKISAHKRVADRRGQRIVIHLFHAAQDRDPLD
jgi:Holliday junction resolvase RusA-like endonuclease